MIIFRDWFHQPTIQAEPQLAQNLEALKARLAERFPSFTSYRFLPLGFVSASVEAMQALVEDPLVYRVWEASDGWKQYRDQYTIVLDALDALRSQTGHQIFAWLRLETQGGILPNDNFEGGWWPPRKGYPRLKDFTSGRIESDNSRILGAPPAWMPVINLSIAPPSGVIYEPNDPVLFALAALSATHLVVVAAGNKGPGPASLNPWAASGAVVSVGATEDNEGTRLADYSSRSDPEGQGPGPDLVAWGQAISGEVGTSYAAPKVALMGVFFAALVAQVHHAWLLAHDENKFGVPLMGWGLVDVTETQDLPERLEAPALPILGVRWDAVSQALRKVDIKIAYRPQLLKKILLAAARPMAGSRRHEVGARFIRDDLFIEYLSKVTIGDLVQWFGPEAHVRRTLAREPAFARDELETLTQVVRRTAPTWFWDAEHQLFMVNGRILPGASSNFDSIRAALETRRPYGGHGSIIAETPFMLST